MCYQLFNPQSIKIICPKYLSANGILKCSWSGFHDPESGIDYYQLDIGTREGYDDVYSSPEIADRISSYAVPDLNLEHNKQYFVTIEARNSVGQKTRAYSNAIIVDDTHPVAGAVIELSGVYQINGTSQDSPWSSVNCTNAQECLKYDTECIQSVHQVSIAWESFTDPETTITRYEIGLGTTTGGSQIKSFYNIPAERTMEIIDNLNLMGITKIYATVRGYNEAGLSSTATSNGAYISYYGAGQPLLKPFTVNDGVLDSKDITKDLDFQSSLDELSASWDFSGDPCPISKYEWSVYRVDGELVQDWIDVQTTTSSSTDEVNMKDGETYYAIVRATNVMGLTMIHRSDGVTVQRDPLIPGRVYDGALIGKDLNYQLSLTSLSAHWDGFGGDVVVAKTIEHTGNEEMEKDATGVQDVDFYEVAIGTDRRYPKTRYNVVPFTNVGKNKTVTFDNLDLQPLTSVYYFTVRAHSASFATAETTSNGMTAGINSTMEVGTIQISKYVNSLNKVEIAWSKFESVLPVLLYYMGICNSSEAVQQLHCQDVIMLSVGSTQGVSGCTTYPFRSVGRDTYIEATNLTLIHGSTYYTAVIGLDESGLCNISRAEFSIDVTGPEEGRMRTGPFYDLPITYSESTEYISVWWEGYNDAESDVREYRLRLLGAPSCSETDDANLQVVVDWISIGPNNTEFRFLDLDLEPNKPYYVELQAINGAGVSVTTKSSPILVDSAEPSPGFVVDGLNFARDETHHGNTHEVSGTFLHFANPTGPSCPERSIQFTEYSINDALNTQGLWTKDGRQWKLTYNQDQMEVTDNILGITLERDTQKQQMLSAAYATNAAMQRSGNYTIQLKAAAGNVDAITSVLFWDGMEGVVGDYIIQPSGDWKQDLCSCCFVQPFDQSSCWCNCTEYLSLAGYNEANPPPVLSSTDSKGSKEEYNHPVNVEFLEQRACGLQLYQRDSEWQATLWCRYHRDDYLIIHDTVVLNFDPSQEMHSYSFSVKVYPTVAEQEQWELSLTIDGILLTALDGIPHLSTSTQLILHVWNKDNVVSSIEDEFNPPKATAYFSDLRIPPESSHPCRYGNPFRAGSSPIVRYLAGIGTERGQVNTVPFKEIASPCIPCLSASACNRFQCEDSCNMTQVTSISFSLLPYRLQVPAFHVYQHQSAIDSNVKTHIASPCIPCLSASACNRFQCEDSCNMTQVTPISFSLLPYRLQVPGFHAYQHPPAIDSSVKTHIASPCIPCLSASACNRFQCEDSCNMTQVTPISFSLLPYRLQVPAFRAYQHQPAIDSSVKTHIASPCIPCLSASACNRFQCEDSCNMTQVTPISFSLLPYRLQVPGFHAYQHQPAIGSNVKTHIASPCIPCLSASACNRFQCEDSCNMTQVTPISFSLLPYRLQVPAFHVYQHQPAIDSSVKTHIASPCIPCLSASACNRFQCEDSCNITQVTPISFSLLPYRLQVPAFHAYQYQPAIGSNVKTHIASPCIPCLSASACNIFQCEDSCNMTQVTPISFSLLPYRLQVPAFHAYQHQSAIDSNVKTHIASPCIPCLSASACNRFQCEDSCNMTQVTPISFSLLPYRLQVPAFHVYQHQPAIDSSVKTHVT
ncbi:uncharacterized protein [Amphiura filiformis]|uniref:uncharacterized protein n=1 Tax=Amphiura filiformis TaxID=82378 RepID=UPI003B21CF36